MDDVEYRNGKIKWGWGQISEGIWGKTAKRVVVQEPNIVEDSYDIYI